MVHRIIPRLDIKGPNVVKGVHLEGLRVGGLPELFAKKYWQPLGHPVRFCIYAALGALGGILCAN